MKITNVIMLKLKKFLGALLFMLPLIGKTQVHLGESFSELKAQNPDKVFKIEYTLDGMKYTKANHPSGTFIYYFDKKTGLIKLCVQNPNDLSSLNKQVEIYNKHYEKVTETIWRIGDTIKVELLFSDETKTFLFYYY